VLGEGMSDRGTRVNHQETPEEVALKEVNTLAEYSRRRDEAADARSDTTDDDRAELFQIQLAKYLKDDQIKTAVQVEYHKPLTQKQRDD